jgi:hypothetical protein
MSTTKILSILEAAQMRLMTKQDGADIKAEIIKWMFLFWIGQIAVLIAAAKFLFSA